MTKTEIFKTIAESQDLTKAQVQGVIEQLIDMACEKAKSEGEFLIPGLGKLALVKRAARMGRNPSTGESIQIPAKQSVKFRLIKAVKVAVGD